MSQTQSLLAWFAVMGLTAVAAYLATLPGTGWLLTGPLLITAIKGQLIVDVFMGMRRAPAAWRAAMLIYVWLICTVIGAIYLI